MLVAHGPLSYLIAYGTRRFWRADRQTKKQRIVLYVIAWIGGMFPDIDLFYFYFVDALQSHRQLLTHSMLPYLIVLILGGLSYYLLRTYAGSRIFWSYIIIYFGIGGLSHIAADSIIGFTIALSPWSDQLIGLPGLAWWQNSVFMRYAVVTIFSLEFVIIGLAVSTWVKRHTVYWKIYWIVVAGMCVGVVAGLFFISNHIYPANGVFYYGDLDQDGQINVVDVDSDGDGVPNRLDTDIDNDGEDNSLDFYRETFMATGAMYDYTNGIGLEVPLRIGLVTTSRFVERMYANMGLFFSTEMLADYQTHPQGYIGQPGNNDFTEQIENWQTWLGHTKQLLPPDTHLNEFDILFFTSGHVGLLTRDQGVDYVLEADSSHVYVKVVPLTEVITREGSLEYIGRVLPKPINKRY